jgi:hypothetical protein
MSPGWILVLLWVVGFPFLLLIPFAQWANDRGHINLARGNGYAVAVGGLLVLIEATVQLVKAMHHG